VVEHCFATKLLCVFCELLLDVSDSKQFKSIVVDNSAVLDLVLAVYNAFHIPPNAQHFRK